MPSIVPYGSGFNGSSSVSSITSFNPDALHSGAIDRLHHQFNYVPQVTAFVDLTAITLASLNLNQSLLGGAEPWESSMNFNSLDLELNSAPGFDDLSFDDLDFSFTI
jgi:hypothetical protein